MHQRYLMMVIKGRDVWDAYDVLEAQFVQIHCLGPAVPRFLEISFIWGMWHHWIYDNITLPSEQCLGTYHLGREADKSHW